jgi:CRP-like cAMP-binding protein
MNNTPWVKEDTKLGLSASRSDAGGERNSPAIRKTRISKAKKRRRTKGPSEKIRSLAAISLAHKVGYLKLSDLIGQDNRELEAFINERLPRRTFKEGETLYPSTVKGPVLFVIKSGSVNVTRPSARGQFYDVKSLEEGTIFGEMPSLGQTMLGAQAIAAETTKVVLINGTDFEKLINLSPSVALNMVRQIGPRLVEAERRHEQAAFQPVTSRLASLLNKLATKNREVVGYTHQEMADMLGVYRETVTNAIAELKQDRLIKVGRKRIVLLDQEGLRKIEAI